MDRVIFHCDLNSFYASVELLRCPARWYGVTYQDDKPQVKAALRKLAEDGLYPTPLWQ